MKHSSGTELNSLWQPVGSPLPHWRPPARPGREVLAGRFCRLEPLAAARHAEALFAAYAAERTGSLWTYLPYGPFADAAAYRAWMEGHWLGSDPLFFAVVEPSTGEVLGTVAFLRIDPNAGSIEVGHLAYSPRLQRTAAATEALFLLLAHAFALGYRRCEWKCDSLNGPSRRAALRLGFTFEGIFRQATVVKGRNRDTAWFSMLDAEWPDRRAALVAWLSPENFDAAGRQRRRLEEFRNGPSVPRSNDPCVT